MLGGSVILAGTALPLVGIFPWSWLKYYVVAGVVLAAVSFVVTGISNRSARLLGDAAFGPSGSSTPYKAGFSRAETLVQQGQYDAAIEAYQAVIGATPGVPEPYLRIARIYRKELRKPDDAAYWYRKVRREAHLTMSQDLAISRELVELILASDNRERAIPELARIVDKFPDTPEQAWAEGLLAELKAAGPRED